MKIAAILGALAGAVAGFAAAGFGAAAVLVSALGDREGGSSMSGFFVFGPVGAVAGALLGAGLTLRFGAASSSWARGLMLAAGIVTALGGILLAFTSSPDRGPSYSHVIEFELELPASSLAGVAIPSSQAMWGAAGAGLDDSPISQFNEKKCAGDICIVSGSVAALGPMNNFRIATLIGSAKHRYALALPQSVTAPADWSDWTQGDGARYRWRIVPSARR